MECAKTKRRVLRSRAIRLILDANEDFQPESNASAMKLDGYMNRLKELQRMLAEGNDPLSDPLNDIWQDEVYETKITSALEYNDQLISCIAKLKGQRHSSKVFPVSHQRQSVGYPSPSTSQEHQPVKVSYAR